MARNSTPPFWNYRLLEPLALFALLNAYLFLFQDALIDDAFINLRYAKTLLASGTWGFFPGQIANTATSPLVILVLTGFGAILGVNPGGVRFVSALWLLSLLWVLTRLSRRLLGNRWGGALAFAVLLVNPLLLSTLGLESLALVVFFFASLELALAQRWRWAGGAAGMLVLCRPDAGLLALTLLFIVPGGRARLWFLVCGLLAILPWYIVSWVHLGALVPDSFFLKTIEHSWGRWTFLTGPRLYLSRFPIATIVSFLPILLLGFCASRAARKTRALGVPAALGAVSHWGALAILGVPPYHWYYAPALSLLAVAGSFAAAACMTEGQPGGWRWVSRISLVGSVAVAGTFILATLTTEGPRLREAPIHTNWATPGEYRAAGEWLKTHHGSGAIQMAVECGTLAYYCDCLLQDPFGDRRWVDERILPRATGPGLAARLIRTNFAFYRGAPAWPVARRSLTHLSDRGRTLPGRIQQWPTTSKWKGGGVLVYAGSAGQ